MKCRACWTDKAYLREESRGFKAMICSCLGLVPLKCHHCFHKFRVPWFMTWGKTLHPPVVRAPSPATVSQPSRPATRRAA